MHLDEAKGKGDDHNDHIDILQRVLELPNFSIWWSFRIKANNNHTDNDYCTEEYEAQYCFEICVNKICIGRS